VGIRLFIRLQILQRRRAELIRNLVRQPAHELATEGILVELGYRPSHQIPRQMF
jgi:hypothetical protein